jgi:hypothetical protein
MEILCVTCEERKPHRHQGFDKRRFFPYNACKRSMENVLPRSMLLPICCLQF